MRVEFTIFGAPRQKKNAGAIVFTGPKCRGCNRGKYPKLLPAKPWVQWCRYAMATLRDWRPEQGIIQSVNCRALFFTDTRRKVDAHNLYEGLADLLEHAGAIADDVLIVSWDGSRVYWDKENPRVEVVLETVE